MDTRAIGKQGLVVSAIGLGCMGMSEFYGPADEGESIGDDPPRARSRRHVPRHRRHVRAVHQRAPGRPGDQGTPRPGRARHEVRQRAPRGRRLVGVNGRPEYVRSACDASLSRLGVDVIDLYYQHRVDPNVPIEDTVGAMAELVRAGKVRYLGLSEAAPATIRRAHAVHPISALQTEYSLWTRDVEDEILPTVRELGIGFVAYSPLGRGFLTGRFRKLGGPPRGRLPRRARRAFEPENFAKNRGSGGARRGDRARLGVTPAQLALAWVLAQGDDIVPIPGTKRLKYLEENAGAVAIRLAPKILAELNEAAPKGATAGDRYPEAAMRAVNR